MNASNAGSPLHFAAPNRPALSWYLVHTKVAAESVASTQLERQGFRIYFPRLAEPVRRQGRSVVAVRALFPRYVFVGIEAGLQSLASVNFTRGVSGIVRFGREVAAVPARVIEQLRQRADPASGLHMLHQPRLSAGAGVRVVGGAFEGMEGIFQRHCGDERVFVLLTLLGQETRVCLPADAVASTSPRSLSFRQPKAEVC
jgi:transcriptional antiterminator RfaH